MPHAIRVNAATPVACQCLCFSCHITLQDVRQACVLSLYAQSLDKLKFVGHSSPKHQKPKQSQPQNVHEMPVDRYAVSGPESSQLAVELVSIFTLARQQISQGTETAQEVYAVRRRQQIKERAVRIAGQINSLPRQLPPRDHLRTQKTKTQDCRHGQPTVVTSFPLLLQRPARNLDRDTAKQNQHGAQPEHLRD